MALRVVSWNIEGRLTRFARSGRGTPEHIVSMLSRLNGDVVFLAEASDEDRVEPGINAAISTLGYQIWTVPYEDADKDRSWSAEKAPNMKLLSKIPIREFKRVRLGGMRNALTAVVTDPESGLSLRIVGVHLDDRSETYRLKQMTDLIALVRSSAVATLVMGDFNAMHKDDIRAALLRSKMFGFISTKWPGARTRDLLLRVRGMAEGQALTELYLSTQLREADGKYQATATPKLRGQEWLPSVRMIQIDHMLLTPELCVAKFQVSKDGGSDHRALSALVAFAGIDKRREA